MKTQKLLTILSLALVPIISSCGKKDDSSPKAAPNTLTASIDGVETSFNTPATAVRETLTSNGVNITFIIAAGKASSGETMAVDVASPNLKAGNTYSGDIDDTGTGAKLEYHTKAGAIYMDLDEHTSSVTITSLTSTLVEGTFTGKVYLHDNDGNITGQKNITDGKFNLPITTNN